MGNFRNDPISLLSEDLILLLFSYFKYKDIISASYVCRNWFRVSRDNALWKKRLLWDFYSRSRYVQDELQMSPLNSEFTWYSEYRRLVDEFPSVEAEVLTAHTDEVLHVAFSNNGRYFSTCSKDCYIRVWNSDFPCHVVIEENLQKRFKWKYTQFSQFNLDDTLLLVSGVHCGIINSTSGEIAIFEIDDVVDSLTFRCRVVNRPYDIFGCWFSRKLIVNGDLNLITSTTVCSDLWLCKASQELHKPNAVVMSKLFKFLNFNTSSIRMVLCTKNVSPFVIGAVNIYDKLKAAKEAGANFNLNEAILRFFTQMGQEYGDENLLDVSADSPSTSTPACQPKTQNSKLANEPLSPSSSNSSFASFYDGGDRLLIFTGGSETCTPHKVCFKVVKAEKVEKMLNEEVMPPDKLDRVHERMRQMRDAREQAAANAAHANPMEMIHDDEQPVNLPGAENNNFVDDAAFLMDNFDFPDHTIDMRGHIIGLALSTDERHLFVNVRPWPDKCTISDPLVPPPIAQQIEIRVIDMERLKLSDKIYRGHTGFTSTDECFFIFLSACDDYLASGSEDNAAYIWDRHYGALLARLPHEKVVNSVAFNPKNDQMLISASDDFTIKVWLSKKVMRTFKS